MSSFIGLFIAAELANQAKIEAGKLEINPDKLHLPNFLSEIALLFRMQATQKGIAFMQIKNDSNKFY